MYRIILHEGVLEIERAGLGEFPDFQSALAEVNRRNAQPKQIYSEISSGLGIGGVGSDDYSMATEAEQNAPEFSKHKSSGQLWQPCAKRGCDEEPVCLDCEYCDKHCRCGK